MSTAEAPVQSDHDPDASDFVRQSPRGEPTWEVARLYPRLGEWTAAQYLSLLTFDGVEAGGAYRVHGEFKKGETATSLLLPGFAVSVTECFAAGEGQSS